MTAGKRKVARALLPTVAIAAAVATVGYLWRSISPAVIPADALPSAPPLTSAQLHQPARLLAGTSGPEQPHRASWHERIAAVLSGAHGHTPALSLLREWAMTDPDEAAAWALQQRVVPHDAAFAAIFNGATIQPDSAVRLARSLSLSDPTRAAEYGKHLIFGLCANGHSALAAEFATSTPAPLDTQRNWLAVAYGQWAEISPASALESAAMLPSAIVDNAFQAAVTGWARSAPESVASFGLTLPAGDLRKFTLIAGLQRWFDQQPDAAAAWLRANGVSAGLDPEYLQRALED